jgi:hypothetical protein
MLHLAHYITYILYFRLWQFGVWGCAEMAVMHVVVWLAGRSFSYIDVFSPPSIYHFTYFSFETFTLHDCIVFHSINVS